MVDVPEDRYGRYQLFKAIDDAFKSGDFDALGRAVGDTPGWIEAMLPCELGLGHPLEYAIYWSPLAFIEQLIEAGCAVNYDDHAGFPALIATLTTDRADRLDLLRLLIRHGADLNQRGVNDWTPLHYAASTRDLAAVQVLLEAGADPALRTRIDGLTSPLEEAEAAAFAEGAALLRQAATRSGLPSSQRRGRW